MIAEKQFTAESITRLKDSALLAILLSSERGNYCTIERSTAILQACQNSLNTLYSLPIEELLQLDGLTYTDAIRLKCSLELAKRRNVSAILEKPKISSSNDVYQLFQYLADSPYEEFWIVVLNKANRVISRIKISEGGVAGTVVDLKRIFHETLNLLGSALILLHNHPSGNLSPSEADKAITKKIKDAGSLMEIAVLDHIIIGNTGYYSFADEGNL
jgi:DNA repair protein RadC